MDTSKLAMYGYLLVVKPCLGGFLPDHIVHIISCSSFHAEDPMKLSSGLMISCASTRPQLASGPWSPVSVPLTS